MPLSQVDAIATARFDAQTGADREVQRILMELLNQMDGFDQNTNVKVSSASHGKHSARLPRCSPRPGYNLLQHQALEKALVWDALAIAARVLCSVRLRNRRLYHRCFACGCSLLQVVPDRRHGVDTSHCWPQQNIAVRVLHTTRCWCAHLACCGRWLLPLACARHDGSQGLTYILAGHHGDQQGGHAGPCAAAARAAGPQDRVPDPGPAAKTPRVPGA
jgi:hypothetical protein